MESCWVSPQQMEENSSGSSSGSHLGHLLPGRDSFAWGCPCPAIAVAWLSPRALRWPHCPWGQDPDAGCPTSLSPEGFGHLLQGCQRAAAPEGARAELV